MRIFVLLLVLLSASSVRAEETASAAAKVPFPIPDIYSLVNDYHGVLSLTQANALNEKLTRLEQKNGTQIVLMIVPTTGEVPIGQYAQDVMNKWDPGNHGDGNGLLFLISAEPTAQFWFITGAGIQGAVPDIKLRHIWRDHLNPHFSRHEWFEGIDATIDALIAAAGGEETKGGISHPMPIVITRDQIIVAILLLIGIAYAAYLLISLKRKKAREST